MIVSKRHLFAATALLAAMLAGPTSAASPTFVGQWDMTTSQGGYFAVQMREGKDGTIAGSFHNGTASQAGTWIGHLTGGGIDLVIDLKQPGLGLVGHGQLYLLGDGNSFQGSIEESAPDGSGKVKATLKGARKGFKFKLSFG